MITWRRALHLVVIGMVVSCVAVVRWESHPREREPQAPQPMTDLPAPAPSSGLERSEDPVAVPAPSPGLERSKDPGAVPAASPGLERSEDLGAAPDRGVAPSPFALASRSEEIPPASSAWAPSPDVSPSEIRNEGVAADLPAAVPSFSTFRVSRIERAVFALAAPAGARGGEKTKTAEGVTDPVLASASRRPIYRPWDGLTGDLSATRGLPESGDDTYTAQYGLTMLRLLPMGRLELQARIGNRDGKRYLSRGAIRFCTFSGWEGTLGDGVISSGSSALINPSLRGAQIERVTSDAGAGHVRFAVAVGRAGLTYRNIENGRYPRRVESASVRYHPGRDLTLEGQAYHLADGGRGVPGESIPGGQGIGLCMVKVGARGQSSASIHGSDFRFAGGGRHEGAQVVVRTFARSGRVDARATWQSTVGTSYRVGNYGALQPVPRLVLDGSLSARLSRTLVAGGWASRWEQPPTVADENEGTDGPMGTLAEARNRATGGDCWGGRLSWTAPRSHTGVSLSGEDRHRITADAEQDITSYTASATQPLGSRTSTSLRWNRLNYSGLQPNHYLTGNLQIRLGRSAHLALEQGTTWQEPFGPRLVSSAEISSIGLLGGRVMLSAQISQMHEQERGRFLPAQTQAAIASGLRLGAGWWISPRFQVTRHRSDQLQTIQVSLSHTPDTSDFDADRSLMDPRPFPRQVLGGSVFSDLNGDGIRQEAEPGVPGVAVLIDNDPQTPVYTDGTGHYRRLVRTGRHLVRILPESVPTVYALRDIEPHEVSVEPDNAVMYSFPMTRQDRCINGCVVRQKQSGLAMPRGVASSENVPGIRIVLNDREFTYTDAAGNFQFRPLSAGTYDVRIDPKTLPFGHVVVGPPAKWMVLDETDASCEFVISRPVQRSSF